MLKMSEEIGDVGQEKGSGLTKSLPIEKNIKLVRELILSQEDQPETHSTSAEIARELNTNCQSVSCIIDEDLDLNLLRKLKVQKLTDSTTEKPWPVRESYCLSILREHYKLHFFSDEKILKFK